MGVGAGLYMCDVLRKVHVRYLISWWVLVFVCHSNISGTAERICTKFTGNTCLVPRSDEFECQGQRSRSPGTKNALYPPITPGNDGMERAQQMTSRSGRRHHSVTADGWFRCPCVRCMFGKTSLALVFSFFVPCSRWSWPSVSYSMHVSISCRILLYDLQSGW